RVCWTIPTNVLVWSIRLGTNSTLGPILLRQGLFGWYANERIGIPRSLRKRFWTTSIDKGLAFFGVARQQFRTGEITNGNPRDVLGGRNRDGIGRELSGVPGWSLTAGRSALGFAHIPAAAHWCGGSCPAARRTMDLDVLVIDPATQTICPLKIS